MSCFLQDRFDIIPPSMCVSSVQTDSHFSHSSPAQRTLFDLIANNSTLKITFLIYIFFWTHERKTYSVFGKELVFQFRYNATLLLATVAHVQMYLRSTSWRHIPIFSTVRLLRRAVGSRATQITFPSSLIINTTDVSSVRKINDYGHVGTACT